MNIVPIISFLAGVASVVSPCVLPIIPVVIGYTLPQRKNTEILAFVIGLFSIFALTIVLTILFTAAIQFYLNYFRILAAAILIILGLMILINKNFFKFSFSYESNKKGIIGSFIWGLLTSLAWAPCYGSYLIALITFSVSSGDPFYSSINIISYTAGFAVSIFAVGLFISQINLEKLMGQSIKIKQISGFLIFLSGLYMLWLVL
ncbi:cytochrome c biogenesis CcdA family protein [Methanobacterium alcaliphilum]|uniref:cytochrome c biogenesis CcdA family protein n=1 Tax=Methanobacterium alcaliphilum TaxID=392018 RepID=UPI00200B551B|nr:cytochrome c biogenesis CcdA family protein [Methanobacterium alcaliphilum]MCK9152142.1 cytochrome c biogenesis CcdA family protein [Methanobacterium alcaliphilum]